MKLGCGKDDKSKTNSYAGTGIWSPQDLLTVGRREIAVAVFVPSDAIPRTIRTGRPFLAESKWYAWTYCVTILDWICCQDGHTQLPTTCGYSWVEEFVIESDEAAETFDPPCEYIPARVVNCNDDSYMDTGLDRPNFKMTPDEDATSPLFVTPGILSCLVPRIRNAVWFVEPSSLYPAEMAEMRIELEADCQLFVFQLREYVPPVLTPDTYNQSSEPRDGMSAPTIV